MRTFFPPLSQKPVAWIDTETTGLDPTVHEVLDVAVVFDLGVATQLGIPHLTTPVGADYAYYAAKIKPQRLDVAEPKALEVNGYTPEAWADASDAADVVKVLQVVLKDVICCGHNVSFDTNFIQNLIQRTGSRFRVGYHQIDTIALAHGRLVPAGLQKLSLDTIREYLGWSKDGGHRALPDALDARRLYKLCTHDVPQHPQAYWIQKAALFG